MALKVSDLSINNHVIKEDFETKYLFLVNKSLNLKLTLKTVKYSDDSVSGESVLLFPALFWGFRTSITSGDYPPTVLPT